MARASVSQNAFNAGEFSALMLGRQDIAKYKAGLYVCLNGIPLIQGGWTRRPGTAFLAQCKFNDKLARLLPFQYSIEQTYILEFGEYYIRFFTEHGILTKTTQNITGISKASTAVVTYSGADTYANDERVLITGVVGMTQVNNREFVVKGVNAGANTFQLYETDGTTAVDSTGYGAWASGGKIGEILEVVTGFQEADLAAVRVTQSADVLFITHPDYPPQELVRNSALSWTLSDVPFTDGPYDTLNAETTTLSPSAATGTVTITASAVTGINDDTGFQSTDVGRLVRIKEGSTWGYCEILTVGSTVSVTADVLSTLTNTNAKVNWRLGVYSDTTGWPSAATFYDDRIFFAGAATYPQRLDGSKTGIYTSFSPSGTDGTVASDDGVSFTLNADDVNAIKWLVPNERGLLAGTSRGEWQIKPSALNEAITPTNISAKPSTRYGSADVAPIAAGKAVLFVQRAARKVREFAYVFEVDGFKAPDLTTLAEHITRPSITEITYQEQPQAIMWGARSDGVLLGLTYERDQGVIAWHRHELGGQSDAAGLYVPVVESVAAVPTPDATRDELYVIVQRYVNGQERRYIEYMSKIWESEDAQEDAFYVDCGWTVINGSPSDTVTGLWHLEGETVGCYVDGAQHVDVTVTNGTVTLSSAGTIVSLGYFFESDGNTLPLEGGSQDGSSQGKVKRISRIGVWLVDTLGLQVGPDADNLTEILVGQWGDNYGEPTALFTGVVRERFEGDYDKLGQVYWRAEGPFPANVLALMPQFQTSDDS